MDDSGDPRLSLGLDGLFRRSCRDGGCRSKLSRFSASGVGEAVAIVATVARRTHQKQPQRLDMYVRDFIGRVEQIVVKSGSLLASLVVVNPESWSSSATHSLSWWGNHRSPWWPQM